MLAVAILAAAVAFIITGLGSSPRHAAEPDSSLSRPYSLPWHAAAPCSQLICRSACSIMQRQCWGRDGAETTAGDLSCHRPLPTLTLVTKLLQYINNTTLQPPSSMALSLHINCIALKEKKHFEMSIVHIQCDKGEHNAKLWNEE